ARGEPKAERGAVPPSPARRERSPADVVVPRPVAGAPGDPRARILPARNPAPARPEIRPPPVVERGPAPLVVGDPDPVLVVVVRPIPRADVGLEVVANYARRRGP